VVLFQLTQPNFKKLQNPLTDLPPCVIIPIMAFEQEPVVERLSIRELSVGERQLLGFGEFLLQVAN
jgi:hypothetical protein